MNAGWTACGNGKRRRYCRWPPRRAPGSPAGKRLLLAFVDLVTSGGLEEVSGGLVPADIGQAEAFVAGPRVAVPGHDIHLEFGGVPGFGGDLNRPVIADGAGGDRGDFAHAFGIDSFDHLFAERFAGRLLAEHSDDRASPTTRRRGCHADTDSTAATTTAANGSGDLASFISQRLCGSARFRGGHGFLYGLFIERRAVDGDGCRTVPAGPDGERRSAIAAYGTLHGADAHEGVAARGRSEEHTSELQSRQY